MRKPKELEHTVIGIPQQQETTMSTTTRTSTAERLGRAFGRGWRAYARGERRASNWLVSKGMPRAGATALVWVVKLAVLGVLLYVAFWFALVLLRSEGHTSQPQALMRATYSVLFL